MQDSLLSRTMEKTYQKPATSWLLKTKYIILFLVISGALGCISLLSIQTGLHLGWMKLLQMICFCAAGILHVKKMRGFNFTKSDDRSKLQFSIQLFVLIFLSLIFVLTLYPQWLNLYLFRFASPVSLH